jgi:hypothetical protein
VKPLEYFINRDPCLYDMPMKKPPDNPEFARFTEAMRHIMTVPKSAIAARDEAIKGERKQTKNQRVLREKD